MSVGNDDPLADFELAIDCPAPPGGWLARGLIEPIRVPAGESLNIELGACDTTGHLGILAPLADQQVQRLGVLAGTIHEAVVSQRVGTASSILV